MIRIPAYWMPGLKQSSLGREFPTTEPEKSRRRLNSLTDFML